MDLMSEESIGALGLLVAEAAERLVDSHNESLDKRAAMLIVESPTFSSESGTLQFGFKVKGNRQSVLDVHLEVSSDTTGDDDAQFHPLNVSLEAVPHCGCEQFKEGGDRCAHSLAVSWWLQEQLSRRSINDVFEFFGELEVDSVAAGRDLVNQVLGLVSGKGSSACEPDGTRLQWRVGLSSSRYYCPISITGYEQRPKKNGKGWTKGKEVRSFDLLRRDFSSRPVDGRIAALVANPSYSFNEDHFAEFQALSLLAGHPNVAWDDVNVRPCQVFSAELVLTLCPTVREDEDQDEEADALIQERNAYYRPELQVNGIRLDLDRNNVVFGYASPVEPIVVVADEKDNRLVVCKLRNPKALKVVQHLLESDLKDVLFDSAAASRFAIGSAEIDRFVHIELPAELAGPIEPVKAELVFDLRPRPGAGLFIALRMHEERFRDLMVPGRAPEIVTCLTDQGPVRLQRDLESERVMADQVIERFELNRLTPDGLDHWVATSDEAALELLGALYGGGDETPRMIWPEGESLKVRGEITPGALKVQIDDRKDWFGLSGSINIEGREIPLAELLSAVRDQRSLVQVGDRQFAKISEAFRKRLQQLGDVIIEERGAMKVADAAVPAVQELISTDVPLEATARWHDSLRRLETLADWCPAQPHELDAVLRDYQLEGYQWLSRLSLWGVGGVLADDMGLGKTVQTLGVLLERAGQGPALVVAPTSVGENWLRETERFTPSLSAYLYRDADRNSLIEKAGPGDLVIVSYQLLQRDAKRFAARAWHTLVLDEAQFIKNAQTKTSQAIRQIEADWRIGLSGTPLENHLGELWSLFRTLSPGLLGSWDRFRQRFADPIERLKDDEKRKSLAQLVRPFILRRTKDRVLTELPPRTEITLHAELSVGERNRYEDARLAALTELSGTGGEEGAGQQRIRTLAWLTKLRQLACHPRLVDQSWKKGSAKLDLLLSLVEELREGNHRALIFSQFVKHLSLIRQALDDRDVQYQYLDGATPAKERQRRVDAFQDGEGDLFLISLKAGGTGLNLTGADYVIHLDPWWNPAVEDQATDRAHRIGQERPVTVYRLVTVGTIEEQILALHADKRELVAGVLDGTDLAAKMDTEMLIRLIKEGAAG